MFSFVSCEYGRPQEFNRSGVFLRLGTLNVGVGSTFFHYCISVSNGEVPEDRSAGWDCQAIFSYLMVFQSFVALLLSSRSSPAVLCFPSHDPKPSSAKHLSSHQQALIFYCCAREAGLISLLIMTCSILVSRRLGPSPILGLQMCLINYLNYSFNCHL